MRLEDLKTKKISDLRGLLVDEAPLVKADTPLSQAASSITKSVSRMAVGVDDKDNVVGVLTGSDVARTVQQRSINPTDLTSTVINRDYVGVDVADTISELVRKLSVTPVRAVVVTDKGRYVGIIDRQKLADRVEELLR
jgi:predicted transcriptional regulator